MSGAPRSLPSKPSLRYLKLEAKRRLAAGEFPALHDAHAAIAREHGLPSWAALKQHILGQSLPDGPALAHVRWIVERFKSAAEQGWVRPAEPELALHFADSFLAAIPPGELIDQIASQAAALHEELVVISQAPLEARIRIARTEYFASAEPDPPHRLDALAARPLTGPVSDARVAASATRTLGDAPADMIALAEESVAELGLAGLVLAGGGPGGGPGDGLGDGGAGGAWGGSDGQAWVVTRGWADLDRAEALDPGHRFPALGLAALVTSTAVLRLVADGTVGLDAPANDYLRAVRLADDTVTVRALLSLTGGVGNPDPARLFGDRVPELVTLTGPVIACDGTRGVLRPTNGSFAALGQLIADSTGSPYADAVTGLVLEPLGMGDSSFPASLAQLGPGTVTCYDLASDGTFTPVTAMICGIPAAGGLWATAADIVRLATRWSSLLPAPLARAAITPQSELDPGGATAGLGWLIEQSAGVAMHGGFATGGIASVLLRLRDGQVHVTMSSQLTSLDLIHERVLRSWGNGGR